MVKLKDILVKVYKMTNFIVLSVRFVGVSIQQILKKLPDNRKTILFTLEDDRLFKHADGMGRYAYLILKLFSDSGYNVYLYKKMNTRKYVQLEVFGRLIYTIDNVKIISRIPDRTEDMIYAFDTVVSDLVNQKWKRQIYVNILKPVTNVFGNMINIPYFMHPKAHISKQFDTIESFRNHERKMRIFFGGNISGFWYDNPDLHQYGQLTRLEGIRTVFQLGEDARLKWNIDEFHQFLKQTEYVNQCCLLRTDQTLAMESKEWFNIVSQSDFFLCLSGSDLPMCHNVIETLSVGTIPIISYHDWFFPALEHKKNAIVYSGRDDLVEKLKDVLKMNKREIEAMRKNVTQYYDDHISNQSFIDRFESYQNDINTIMLHPRLICTDGEQADGQQIFEEIKNQQKQMSVLKTNSLPDASGELTRS